MGSILLHEAVRVLSRKRRYPFHPNCSFLMKIIEKDPESAFKANSHGQLALHLVCERSDEYRGHSSSLPVTDLLLDINPTSVDQPDKKGCFPLHCAVRGLAEKYTGVSRRIITPKAAMAKDNDGHTPLHYVAKAAHTRDCDENIEELLRVILNASPGALHVKSNSGDLPIHYAAEAGHLPLFKILAERSSQGLAVRNGAGKLPMDIAAARSFRDYNRLIFYFKRPGPARLHGQNSNSPVGCGFIMRYLTLM